MSFVDWLPFCLGVNVLLKNFQGHYIKWHRCHQLGALLSHWGRVTHMCVSEIIIIGSDDDLSPDRRQAIIWTNAGILLIGPLGTNFSEILIEIQTFSFKKSHLKMSSAKWRLFRLTLNVLSKNANLTAKSSLFLKPGIKGIP